MVDHHRSSPLVSERAGTPDAISDEVSATRCSDNLPSRPHPPSPRLGDALAAVRESARAHLPPRRFPLCVFERSAQVSTQENVSDGENTVRKAAIDKIIRDSNVQTSEWNQLICPITMYRCEGDLSYLCPEYGCARKGGLSPRSEENF